MNGVKNFLLKKIGQNTYMHNLSALIALLCCATNSSASCEYIIDSEWNTGFTASVKITNSGVSAVNGWIIGWQYNANKITSSWNAMVTGNNPYSASALNWNGTIQPGQSVSFGFQGDKNGASAEKPIVAGSLCDSTASSSSNSSRALSSSSIVATISSSKSSASSVLASSSLSSASSVKSSARSSSIQSTSSSIQSTSSSIQSTSSSIISSKSSANNSSIASSITSTSSSSIASNQQCNWYGTLYPLCVTTTSGWGYENNKSCIAAVTCSAQPAPYGIVGVSSSSLKSSSSSLINSSANSSIGSSISSSINSSKSSASSAKTSSSTISSSLASSSSKTSNSSSSVTTTGILFEDNFESGAINTQPAGWDNFIAWNYNTTNSNANSTFAVIESGKAYSGTKAIHFKGSLAQIVRKLPAGIQRLHLRAYVNLSKKLGNDATDNHEHIMGIKKTQDANNEIRVGQIKGVLGTNEVPSDNIAPKMDKWYGGTELSPNTWYCVETAFYADTAYDELYMWVNGNLVHSITSANDWNNGALGADWLSDKFNYVMFGFHSFSGNTADVWMDDIVVSTKPIGCNVN